MPSQHDKWGCSRHNGLVQCLGYESGPSGSSADEGSEMHKIAELSIKAGFKEPLFPELFKTGNQVTADHVAIVKNYIGNVKRLYEKYLDQYGDSLQMLVEHPISIKEWEVEISTVDLAFYVPFQLIHIVDLKTGRTFVPATNPQMRGYLVGCMEQMPSERFIASICQPLVSPDLLTVEFNSDEMERHIKYMKFILAAAKREHAPRTVCKYCDWCVHQATCPAVAARIALIDVNADKKELSNQLLARMTKYAMSVKKVIGAIEQRAYALLETGSRLVIDAETELALVDGRPTRVWQNEKRAIGELCKIAIEKGLAENEDEAMKLFVTEEVKTSVASPSQAEAIVGRAKAVKERMNPLIYSVPGKKKMAVVKTATPALNNEEEEDHE